MERLIDSRLAISWERLYSAVVLPLLVSVFSLSCISSFAQSFTTPSYFEAIAIPTRLYQQKKYQEAAIAYSKAFWTNNDKGTAEDRYRAACAWSMVGNADSAFAQLSRLVVAGKFDQYSRLSAEKKLLFLQSDQRWGGILALAKQNYDSRPLVSKELVRELEAMGRADLKSRRKMIRLENMFGSEDQRTVAAGKEVRSQDSLNTVRVKTIISNMGWPGFKEVGREANTAVFLIIQHSDFDTQVEYLPIMRKAVADHKAYPADLALLEDRILINTCEEQVYGSQLGTDSVTRKDCLYAIKDPEGLDDRRAKIGLQPMQEYLKYWKMDWNPSDYPICECKVKGN